MNSRQLLTHSQHSALIERTSQWPIQQNGMALIEALVASAVLGVGMLGAVQLTAQGLQTATDTRQRLLAHGLALDAMECHQASRADCPMNDQTTEQAIMIWSKASAYFCMVRRRLGRSRQDWSVQRCKGC